jgi:hypothetical protein
MTLLVHAGQEKLAGYGDDGGVENSRTSSYVRRSVETRVEKPDYGVEMCEISGTVTEIRKARFQGGGEPGVKKTYTYE